MVRCHIKTDVIFFFFLQAMKKSGSHKFLIDGFPRNQDNLDGWNRQMASNVNLLFVLFFDCPQEVRNLRTC